MEPEIIDGYSNEIQQLLSRYSWLFNFKMTQILTENVFDDMPCEWFEFGQNATVQVLHDIADGATQDGWPSELASFVGLCGRLRRWQQRRGPPPSEQPPPVTLTRGISAKKRHELGRMVPAVRRLCRQADAGLVMDVGAGVGHLAECLRQSSELRVLGLEQSAPLVEAAGRRRRQLSADGAAGCPACLCVARCQVSDSESGQQQLQQLAADFAANQCSCGTAAAAGRQPARWCLTGLHCCGDLAPQLLRLLLRLPEARALLLLSCCYHKAADGRLLSRRLAAARLGPFGRRLACQQSVATWCRQTAAQHERHAAAAGWRALLQAVADRTGRAVSDRRRHGTHRYASFTEYAAAMLEPAESGDRLPRTDSGDRLPRTDSGDQPRTDSGDRLLRTDSGDRLPRTDSGDQLPRTNSGDRLPRTDSGDQPRTDSGDRLPRTDSGDRQPRTDSGDQLPRTNSGDRLPRTDSSDQPRTDSGDRLPRTDSGDRQLRTDSGDRQLRTDSGDRQLRTDSGDLLLRTVAAAVSDQYASQLRCVEFLTALQACLQPALEGLLLLDRVFFLREHGLSAELVSLFDDRLSPRTWALIAWKP